MNMIVTCLVRCFVVLAGYAAAAVAASAFLTITFIAATGLNAEDGSRIYAGPLVFAVPFVSLFAAYFAFIPSLPVIALSEILRRRDWLFHALGGGVVAFAVLGYFWRATSEQFVADFIAAPDIENSMVNSPGLAMLFIAAGMCGGIAYWLVAGRSAGSWRLPPRGNPTSSGP